jgi:Holliday junction resolvase
MRRAARQDLTHKAIKTGLIEAGFSVFDTSQLGNNFPDLVAGRNGLNIMIECKSRRARTERGRQTSADRLSEGQRQFMEEWRGAKPVPAYTVEDVLFAFRLLTKRVGWSA